MRQLWWMAEARMLLEWDQSGLIWSAVANTSRDAKKPSKAFTPGDVHPLRNTQDYEPRPIKADITVLKKLLRNG